MPSAHAMDDLRTGEPRIPAAVLRELASAALREDLTDGDVTTDLVVPEDADAAGTVVAREAGVLAGLPVARAVFDVVDPTLRIESEREDGARLAPGTPILRVEGRARGILQAERTALNFLQRLSGIATLTGRFVDAVDGTGVRIVDTRKTTPGLRRLEKYAVRCGGGWNHRFGLSDGFLLKDNHRAVLTTEGTKLKEALRRARDRLSHTILMEVEIDAPGQLEEAIEAGVDAVLLDNFPPDQLRRAVEEARGRVLLEASGGITLETVRQVAETGIDLISVGALTHSAPALDVALDFETT